MLFRQASRAPLSGFRIPQAQLAARRGVGVTRDALPANALAESRTVDRPAAKAGDKSPHSETIRRSWTCRARARSIGADARAVRREKGSLCRLDQRPGSHDREGRRRQTLVLRQPLADRTSVRIVPSGSSAQFCGERSFAAGSEAGITPARRRVRVAAPTRHRRRIRATVPAAGEAVQSVPRCSQQEMPADQDQGERGTSEELHGPVFLKTGPTAANDTWTADFVKLAVPTLTKKIW